MPISCKKINDYLKEVCSQIRFKKSHLSISQELYTHIMDQKEAFLEEGLSPEEALDEAIASMGDPVEVGMQLDRVYRPKPKWIVILGISLMVLLGICLQLTVGRINDIGDNAVFQTIKILPLALGAAFLSYWLDYTVLAVYQKYLMILFLFPIALSIFVTLYPLTTIYYYLALFLPIVYAICLWNLRKKGYLPLLFSSILYGLCSVCLTYLSKQLVLVPILALSGLILLTAAILKRWFSVDRRLALLMIYLPVGILSVIPFIGNSFAAQRARMLFDFSNEYEGNYILEQVHQIRNNLLPFAESGNDFLQGTAVYQQTDFILLSSAQKYGYMPIAFIIFCLVLILTYMFYLTFRTKNQLGFLLSLSISSYFAIQMLGSVLANLGFLNIFGWNLPFLGFGQAYLLLHAFLIGIFLSIHRIKDCTDETASICERKKHRLGSKVPL